MAFLGIDPMIAWAEADPMRLEALQVSVEQAVRAREQLARFQAFETIIALGQAFKQWGILR